jgi:hypothetical protein
MRHRMFSIIVAATVLGLSVVIAAAVDRGPESIDIYGGRSGKVPFSHVQHQDRIKDCNVCHRVFPQETEAIKRLKEAGKLKAKKVMNLQCIKCHKQEKKAGKPHGPVTCKTCHQK